MILFGKKLVPLSEKIPQETDDTVSYLAELPGAATDEMHLLFIEHGAPLNKLNGYFDGRTPLMAAAEKGVISAVKILKEAGANWRFVNGRGDTARSLAEKEGTSRHRLSD